MTDRKPQDPSNRPRRTLRTDAAAVLTTCPGWQVRQAARRISRFLEDRLAGAGLTLPQFHLMCLLAAAEDDRMGALALRAGLDQSTLSRNLDGLARAGLVEITSVERDRRRRAAWLTETGALKLEAAMPLWRRAQGDLAEILDTALARDLAAGTVGLERRDLGEERE